ncbi:hypothetical protein Tco_1571683 [Tanacetum coccineum]
MHETSVPVYMDVVEKADPFACNQTQNLGSFTSQMASSDMLSTIRGNHIATPSPASFDIRNCCSDQPTNTSCMSFYVSLMSSLLKKKNYSLILRINFNWRKQIMSLLLAANKNLFRNAKT